MASAASRCRYRSRPSNAVHRPSGPWTRLATTRWVCSSGSPSLDVRWSNPTAQEPLSGHVLDTAVATTGPEVSVQVADRLGQPSMMGRQHRLAGGWVAQAVEDRDALGRPQDHVEAWHGVAAMGTAEQLASRGVAALEHGLEPGHGCFAFQPKAGGAGAVPPAWGLAVAGEILFVVIRKFAGVVLLTAHRELGDVGHHPAAPSPPPLAPATHPWCIALLDDFGSSVERTATLHPLC